jgi:hypothetical protein
MDAFNPDNIGGYRLEDVTTTSRAEEITRKASRFIGNNNNVDDAGRGGLGRDYQSSDKEGGRMRITGSKEANLIFKLIGVCFVVWFSATLAEIVSMKFLPHTHAPDSRPRSGAVILGTMERGVDYTVVPKYDTSQEYLKSKRKFYDENGEEIYVEEKKR